MSRRRVRFGDLEGRWADEHPGFPWYNIHWAWHVFLIWPMILGGISTLVRGVLVYNPATNTWERKALSALPPQQRAHG